MAIERYPRRVHELLQKHWAHVTKTFPHIAPFTLGEIDVILAGLPGRVVKKSKPMDITRAHQFKQAVSVVGSGLESGYIKSSAAEMKDYKAVYAIRVDANCSECGKPFAHGFMNSQKTCLKPVCVMRAMAKMH